MDTEQRRYNERIARLRRHEYPMLNGSTYLDHAGTTLYSRSLIESFSAEMMSSLVGNPHSASRSANRTGSRIDQIRTRALRFFRASPEHYDLVFVANATAAIKLVAEAFRDRCGGFAYAYHKDSHTSLVGVREVAAKGSWCLRSDWEVQDWLERLSWAGADDNEAGEPILFGYPGQSNMNGRRLPLHWPRALRASQRPSAYSLLDAAALASTAPLDLSDAENGPDFVCLSFYKIFGFPDLGALIVRKDVAHVFDHRRYFGGGTVEMAVALDATWHFKKESSLHARLEDGSLPMRSILALDCALDAHRKLYGSMSDVSKHTAWLAQSLYERMAALRHGNGSPVAKIYKDPLSVYGDAQTQGAVVTFNLRNSRGQWLSNHTLNCAASDAGFHIRTGTLCNPGGMAGALDISADELRGYFDGGFRCGAKEDVRDGKVVGMARISLGASSTMDDVDRWMAFVERLVVDKKPESSEPDAVPVDNTALHTATKHNYLHSLASSLRNWKIRACSPSRKEAAAVNVAPIEAENVRGEELEVHTVDLTTLKSLPDIHFQTARWEGVAVID